MPEVDRGGRIPLHYAALEGTVDDVTRLLQDGQDVHAVDYAGFHHCISQRNPVASTTSEY